MFKIYFESFPTEWKTKQEIFYYHAQQRPSFKCKTTCEVWMLQFCHRLIICIGYKQKKKKYISTSYTTPIDYLGLDECHMIWLNYK